MIIMMCCVQEREKLKEEKKKYAERLKLLNKRTEDLECDDLKVSKRKKEKPGLTLDMF